MAKKETWELQDQIDREMAADISRDRNMTDYVFANNGKPFMTLAGLMKFANDECYESEIVSIEQNDNFVDVVVKVTTMPDDDGRTYSRYSGRTEYRKEANGKPNPHALAIAINVATKNAVKQLLYGHPEIEKLLENTKVEPAPVQEPAPKPAESKPKAEKAEPKQNGNGNGKPENWEALSMRDKALHYYNAHLPVLETINAHEKPVGEVFKDYLCFHMLVKPENMTDDHHREVVEQFLEGGMGNIGEFFSQVPEDFEAQMEKHRSFLDNQA